MVVVLASEVLAATPVVLYPVQLTVELRIKKEDGLNRDFTCSN